MAPENRLDGCTEFDERLIESAFAPAPDGALDSHLASCARCQRARDRYLEAADAIGGALAFESAAVPSRRLRRVAAAALAAIALAAAVLFWTGRFASPGIEVTPGRGAVVAEVDSNRFAIDDGVATFAARRAELEVATPLGIVRTSEGRFTVTIERRRAGKFAAAAAGITVTVAVAVGVAFWDAARDEAAATVAEIRAGESLSRERTDPAPLGAPPASGAPPEPVPAPIPAVAAAVGRLVDAVSGEPVSGARVAAVAFGSWNLPELAGAATDADGRFRLEGIPRRLEALRIVPLVHAPFLRRPPIGPPDVDAYFAALDRGAAPAPLDLGTLRVARGALVSGVVRRSDGTPVPDATILVFEPDAASGRAIAESREVGRADSDGRFALDSRLAPDESRSGQPLVVAAVASDGLAWTSLAIAPGRERADGVEIVIEKCIRLVATVLDENERPVEGAEVTARPEFPPLGILARVLPRHAWLGGPESIRSVFTAMTDSEGIARLTRLPMGGSGDYVIDASQGERRSTEIPIRLDADDTIELRFRLRGPDSGAVVGRVTDAAGSPIANATVFEGSGSTALSGEDGAYRLAVLPQPGLKIRAQAAGYAPAQESLRIEAFDVESVEVDFRLEPLARVAGRVVDDSGKPVAGALVNLNRLGNDPQGATTDAQGLFVFESATASEWGLRVLPPEPADEWRVPERPLVVRGVGPEVEQEITVVLTRVGAGRGRLVADIVDIATGAALDPVEAWLAADESSDPFSRVRTVPVKRESGRVVAERLTPGAWRLWVSVSDGRAAIRDFTVGDAGESAELRLRVEVGARGSVDGIVTTAKGTHFVEAHVVARCVGPVAGRVSGTGGSTTPLEATARVNADGTFRLEKLVPGRYSLEFRSDEHSGEAEATVVSAESTRADIQAVKSGWITFRTGPAGVRSLASIAFSRDDGWAPPGVERFAVPSDRAVAQTVPIRPGRVAYEVRFERLDHTGREAAARVTGEATVGEGETTEIDVPIIPPE